MNTPTVDTTSEKSPGRVEAAWLAAAMPPLTAAIFMVPVLAAVPLLVDGAQVLSAMVNAPAIAAALSAPLSFVLVRRMLVARDHRAPWRAAAISIAGLAAIMAAPYLSAHPLVIASVPLAALATTVAAIASGDAPEAPS